MQKKFIASVYVHQLAKLVQNWWSVRVVGPSMLGSSSKTFAQVAPFDVLLCPGEIAIHATSNNKFNATLHLPFISVLVCCLQQPKIPVLQLMPFAKSSKSTLQLSEWANRPNLWVWWNRLSQVLVLFTCSFLMPIVVNYCTFQTTAEYI
jgi:hypothetical protein